MGVTMSKTRPAEEMHMGALIRGALERAGVDHVVTRQFLAVQARGGRVLLSAHDCNGGQHYDTGRAQFVGMTALWVATGGARGEVVYDGRPGSLGPVADAEACARAVAAYVAEHPASRPTTAAETSPDASRTCGHLPQSADVPQVRQALRVLRQGGQQLAVFDAAHRCVSAGAYLDPRRATGEVVLGYCSAQRQDHCGRTTVWDSEELHAEREQIVTAYAGLFRASCWDVKESRERDRGGRERLVRLILYPAQPVEPSASAATAADPLPARFA